VDLTVEIVDSVDIKIRFKDLMKAVDDVDMNAVDIVDMTVKVVNGIDIKN